jgi:hypothetical protein
MQWILKPESLYEPPLLGELSERPMDDSDIYGISLIHLSDVLELASKFGTLARLRLGGTLESVGFSALSSHVSDHSVGEEALTQQSLLISELREQPDPANVSFVFRAVDVYAAGVFRLALEVTDADEIDTSIRPRNRFVSELDIIEGGDRLIDELSRGVYTPGSEHPDRPNLRVVSDESS